MKTIPLTRGQSALVDDEDFEKLNRFKWYADRPKNIFYAARMAPIKNGKRKKLWMHREILGLVSGEINHFPDPNGCNNQKSNLHAGTRRDNLQSFVTKRLGATSRFRGVSWRTREGKWCAQIKLKEKQLHLGYFCSSEEAARAYDLAASKYFGARCHLNFPGPRST